MIQIICFLFGSLKMCSKFGNVYISILQEVNLFSASSVGVSCQIPILTTRVRVPAGAFSFFFFFFEIQPKKYQLPI